MRLFVAVTDNDWFRPHASLNRVDEVNFWRPSSEAGFKALQPGELLLFKLHAPMGTTIEATYRGGNVERLKVTPASRAADRCEYRSKSSSVTPAISQPFLRLSIA